MFSISLKLDVLLDGILTFVVIIVSALNAREKDVSLVEVFWMVQYAHRILSNSSTHASFLSSSFVFKMPLMFLLMASTCPLDCRWVGEANELAILCFEQKFLNFSLSNYFLLSLATTLGMPNQQMIFFLINLGVFILVMLVSGIAFACLVK